MMSSFALYHALITTNCIFFLNNSFFIELPVVSQAMVFEQLIKTGVMKNKDAHVMAMELYAPFYLYHLYAETGEELERKFSQHVDNFWESYL